MMWKGLLIAMIPSLLMAATPIEWSKQDWGTMGITHLEHALFPDDSRKDGYKTNTNTYPYEGHYDDNQVAFAIPKGYQPGTKLDIVVIYHGHVNEAPLFMTNCKAGEYFCEAGKNAILVVPQGPKNAPDSSGGKMEKPGEFALMINELINVWKSQKVIPQNAKLNTLIIGGYSGGYRPTAFCLKQGGMNQFIKEIWLFDAAYDFQDDLSNLVTTNPKTVFRGLYTDHQTNYHLRMMTNMAVAKVPFTVINDGDNDAGVTEVLKNNSHVFIHTVLPHDAVAFSKNYMSRFVKNSPTLKNIK